MSRAKLITFAGPATSRSLDNASGRLLLTNVRETAGAVAKFRIWDGSKAQGNILVTANLAANGTFYQRHGAWLLPFRTGLYLEVITGTIEGSVSVHNCPHDEPEAEPVVIIGDLQIGPIDVTGAP